MLGLQDIFLKIREGLRSVKAFSLCFPLSRDFVSIIPEDHDSDSSGT